MIRQSLVVVWATAVLFVCFDQSVACEIDLPCESVREIAVSRGIIHLSAGREEIVYVACVYLNASQTVLQKALEDCPDQTISIVGHKFKTRIHLTDISTNGSWFSIIRSTPEEALNEGLNFCPEKVKSYLSEADGG
ncbi:hypothetical protein [Pseudodesulfovibrio profundus]|nr:hypothetical protein [Pseudodesulfovibrio profundus]